MSFFLIGYIVVVVVTLLIGLMCLQVERGGWSELCIYDFLIIGLISAIPLLNIAVISVSIGFIKEAQDFPGKVEYFKW